MLFQKAERRKKKAKERHSPRKQQPFKTINTSSKQGTPRPHEAMAAADNPWKCLKDQLMDKKKFEQFDKKRSLRLLERKLHSLERKKTYILKYIKGKVKVFDVKDEFVVFVTYKPQTKDNVEQRLQSDTEQLSEDNNPHNKPSSSVVGVMNIRTDSVHEHDCMTEQFPIQIKIFENFEQNLIFSVVLEKTVLFYQHSKALKEYDEVPALELIYSFGLPSLVQRGARRQSIMKRIDIFQQHQLRQRVKLGGKTERFSSFLYLSDLQCLLYIKPGFFFIGQKVVGRGAGGDSFSFGRLQADDFENHSLKMLVRNESFKHKDVLFSFSLDKILVCKLQRAEHLQGRICDVRLLTHWKAQSGSSITSLEPFQESYLASTCQMGRLRIWKIHLNSAATACQPELVQQIIAFRGACIRSMSSNANFLAIGGSNGEIIIYGRDREGRRRSKPHFSNKQHLIREFDRIEGYSNQVASVSINNKNKVIALIQGKLRVWPASYLMQEYDFDDILDIPFRSNAKKRKNEGRAPIQRLTSTAAKEEPVARIKRLEYFCYKSRRTEQECILAYSDYGAGSGYLSLWMKVRKEETRKEVLDKLAKLKSHKTVFKFKTLGQGKATSNESLIPDSSLVKDSTEAASPFPRSRTQKRGKFRTQFVKKIDFLEKTGLFRLGQKKSKTDDFGSSDLSKKSWKLTQQFKPLTNSKGFIISKNGSSLILLDQIKLTALVYEIWSSYEATKRPKESNKGRFYLIQKIDKEVSKNFWQLCCPAINEFATTFCLIDAEDVCIKVWRRCKTEAKITDFELMEKTVTLIVSPTTTLDLMHYFVSLEVKIQPKKVTSGSKLGEERDRFVVTKVDGVYIFNYTDDDKTHPELVHTMGSSFCDDWGPEERIVYFCKDLGVIISEIKERVSIDQVHQKVIVRRKIVQNTLLRAGMSHKKTFKERRKSIFEASSRSKKSPLGAVIRFLKGYEIHQILDYSHFDADCSKQFSVKAFYTEEVNQHYFSHNSNTLMPLGPNTSQGSLKTHNHSLNLDRRSWTKHRLKRDNSRSNSLHRGDDSGSPLNRSRQLSLTGGGGQLRPTLSQSLKNFKFSKKRIYLLAFHASEDSSRTDSYYQIYQLSMDLKFVQLFELEASQGICFDRNLRFIAHASKNNDSKIYVNENKYTPGKLPECLSLYKFLIEMLEGNKNFINPAKLEEFCEYLKKNEFAYNELIIHKELNILYLCVLSENPGTLQKGLEYFGYNRSIYNNSAQLDYTEQLVSLRSADSSRIEKAESKKENSALVSYSEEDPLVKAIEMNNLNLMDVFADYFVDNPIASSQFSENLFFKFLESNSKKMKKVAVDLFLVKGFNEKGLFISNSFPLDKENFMVIKTHNFERDLEFKNELITLAKEKQGVYKQQSVQHLTTSFALDMSLSSNFTAKFSQFMQKAEPEIIKSNLKLIIRYTWLNNKLYIVLYSLVNWVSMVSMLVWVVWLEHFVSVFYLGMFCQSVVVCFELMVIVGAPKIYITDFKFWSLIFHLAVMVMMVLNFTYTTDRLFKNISFYNEAYNIVVTGLLSFHLSRSLTMWRFWDKTRYLVAMVKRSFLEMRSFIIILLFTVFSFSVIQIQVGKTVAAGSAAVNEENLSFLTSFKMTYDLAYGQLPDSSKMNMVQYFHYVLSTIFLPLVLMNLFIAIIWNTFSVVKKNREVADYVEMAGVIHEFSIVARLVKRLFRLTSENGFYHILKRSVQPAERVDHQKVRKEEAGLGGGDVEGLVQQVVGNLEAISKDNEALRKRVSSLEGSIAELISNGNRQNELLEVLIHSFPGGGGGGMGSPGVALPKELTKNFDVNVGNSLSPPEINHKK